jgi:hypothetical protein
MTLNTDLHAAILKALKSSKGMETKELAAATGLPPRRVQEATRQLAETHTIFRGFYGWLIFKKPHPATRKKLEAIRANHLGL